MHPEQVLDLQMELINKARNVPEWSKFLGAVVGEDIQESYPEMSKAAVDTSVDRLMESMKVMPEVAYAYLVTADMLDLVVVSSRMLDDTDVYRRDLLPTEAGFLVFDKPLETHDVRGEVLRIHHILWGPMSATWDGHLQSGTIVYLFTDFARDRDSLTRIFEHPIFQDRHRPQDEYVDAFTKRVGLHWGSCGITLILDGLSIGPSVAEITESRIERLREEGVVPGEPDNVMRIVFALWRMLGQTITDVKEGVLSRGVRRRARRMNIPDRVSVIDLRRIAKGEGEGVGVGVEAVVWSHRWYSRGHWAWRHCGENHPLAEDDGEGGWRCRVWVRESIKGPADKPLVITDKVYRLKR